MERRVSVGTRSSVGRDDPARRPIRFCMVMKRRTGVIPPGFAWYINGDPGAPSHMVLRGNGTAGRGRPALHTYLVGTPQERIIRWAQRPIRFCVAMERRAGVVPPYIRTSRVRRRGRHHPKFPTAAPIRPVQAWAGQWYQCRRPLSSHRPPGCTPPQRCRSAPARPGCAAPGG